MTKKKISLSIVFAMILTIIAASIMPVFASAPTHSAKYDGKGIVDIDFFQKVQYKNLKITVKDSSGKAYKAIVTDIDNNDIEFKIRNYKAGKKYTYKISGVRTRGTKKYGTVKGKVSIPKAAAKAKVREVEYDYEDGDVDFSISKRVTWNNPSITIKKGNTRVSAWITDFDSDDLEVHTGWLSPGTYKYTIKGAVQMSTSKAVTMTGSFTVY